MRLWVTCWVLVLASVGCSRSISMEFPPQVLTVVTYSQGKAIQRCSIAPGSPKFIKLNDFMKHSAAGWHSRSADYVPSLVVIGADVNLYFTADSVVINYSKGEYSRSVSPDAYAFLNCAAK